jgi:hypothetical protein
MRTTVTIDDRLLAAAKASARESGQTLGEFVEESLRLRLTKRPTTRSPRIPVFTQGTGLRPGLDASSNRSLFDALDEAGDLA